MNVNVLFSRIVCEMDPAAADSRPGPVQLCVSECRPELKARSSQLYSFVVWPLVFLIMNSTRSEQIYS